MAGLWIRGSVLLRDNLGNIAKIGVIVAAAAIDPSGGAIKALQIAMQAISKALSPRAESGEGAGFAGGPGIVGDYGAVEDRATLTFSAADGSTQLVEVIAPLTTCFVANSVVVDPAAVGIVDVIAFYTGTAVSKFNQSLTYVKGKRTRKRQMKV